MRLVFSEFAPGEAAGLTRISVEQQRNLRRHDYLPKKHKGWTRFSIRDVANLSIIAELSELGVPPSRSSVAAVTPVDPRTTQSASTIICAFACNDRDAIDDRLSPAEVPVKTSGYLPQYLAIKARNECEFVSAADFPELLKQHSKVIALDLKALARKLVERAKKPLVTFTPYE